MLPNAIIDFFAKPASKRRTIFLTGCLLFGCQEMVSSQSMPGNQITVEVYVSSRAGDRMTRKKDAVFTASTKAAPQAIRVDEGQSFQEIAGFGATFNEAGMICLNSLPPEARSKVLGSLFDTLKGAGYTLMKSPIAACDFASAGPWYSYDETPGDTLMARFSIRRDLGPNGLITYIKEANKYGHFKIESPMDFAPDWMYFSLKKGDKYIKPVYYPALARYYSRYLRSYQENGVQIDFLNLFNEANNEWYSNETYAEIAELIKNYVAPQLKRDGVRVEIQFGETANRPEAVEKLLPSLDDTALQHRIHSLTVHGYDWDKFYNLTYLHLRYPRFPIWQTEVCYARPNNIPPNGPSTLPDLDFKDGEYWGNMIANDMKNWVSAWIYWNMILDEQGGPWLVSPEHGDPDHNVQHPVVIINRETGKVYYTGLYYYLAHFSRFVRPGAQRIACDGGRDNLNVVAFRNKNQSVVLNIINNGEKTESQVSWENSILDQELPGHSITTLKWKGPVRP